MSDQQTQNLPEKFIERLQLIYPERFPEVLDAMSKPTTISFRLNPLQADPKQTYQQLITAGFQLQPVTQFPNTYQLIDNAKRTLTDSDYFQKGQLYLQNLSSMLPALALELQPDDLVLDLAAAPGSKTSQIASLMNNQGLIIANDLSKARIFQLARVLNQLGVTNTKTSLFPGEKIWQRYPNYFEKSLVDAPCSMEGMFKSYDPKTYDHWSPKKVKLLSQRQKYLLRSAISATKPGGIIVYSTCTISPEENELVIDWILKKCPEVKLEELNLDFAPLVAGLTAWGKHQLAPQLSLTGRIIPNQQFEAFFIAKLRKVS